MVVRERAYGGAHCAVHRAWQAVQLPTACGDKPGDARAGGPALPQYRQRELDQAMQYIQKALDGGQDVIFHCMQSFHRAPVAAAAVYRRVTGGSATVHTCFMKSFVAATSQIKYFFV